MAEVSQQNGELQRKLTFKDVFFLSFGGMSPLLSILTYGAFAITLAGYNAPIVMIIGTLLVLLNGLSVTQLAKRFSSSGGYYTYAFQALSARIGFDTGWMYMFYSILYGLAYFVGGIFIITTVLGIPVLYAFLIIMVPSVTFLIIGIGVSSKYAIFAVTIEISLMVAIIIYSFYIAGLKFYFPSPTIYHISGAGFVLGILFAMGIPTGYGSIAPVSGEVKNPKETVGRSVISVILVGGALSTLMIYAFANLILQNGILNTPVMSTQLPVVGIIRNFFGRDGYLFYYAVAIATINDAILAMLSFGSAASRTLFRMGYDRTILPIFGRKVGDRPLMATIFTSALMIFISLLMLLSVGSETSFVILGTIASLGGLFIHVSANFSLIRIGYRRGKRLMKKANDSLFRIFADFEELILATTGAVISSVVLIYSAYSTVPDYTMVFLVWIVIGFILSEVKGIVGKTPNEVDVSREGIIVAQNLMSITVGDSLNKESQAIVGLNENLSDVLEKLLKSKLPAAVVVDKNNMPVGRIEVINLLLLPKNALNARYVRQVHLEKSVNIKSNENVADAIRILKENGVSTLTVIDDQGKAVGAISDREVMSKLSEVEKPNLE